MNNMNRRRVLRGMMGGGATTVALPFLDCFLNSNGNALADGKPMPTRFGSWFWGLGIARGAFNPKQTGLNWEITPELESLKPVKSLFNVFTDYMVYRDLRCRVPLLRLGGDPQRPISGAAYGPPGRHLRRDGRQ